MLYFIWFFNLHTISKEHEIAVDLFVSFQPILRQYSISIPPENVKKSLTLIALTP